jgi:hypothetical protein
MGEQQDREDGRAYALIMKTLDASLGYRPAAVSVAVARAADRPGAPFRHQLVNADDKFATRDGPCRRYHARTSRPWT